MYIGFFISHRPPCSEVLCLGIVTFEQGVAWLTGSYSMAIRPIEEHPCDLDRKWKPDHADCTHVFQLRQVRQKNS